MKEYYFLAALLPQLEIGHVPALGMDELKELLKVNLDSSDLRLAHRLLRQVDVENLRSFWLKAPLDKRGVLDEKGIEQALESETWDGDEEFPNYLVDYLRKYESSEERVAQFQQLLIAYYHEQEESCSGFLHDYFAFQREWQLVMLGFRAKRLNRDLFQELKDEDVSDPIVAQILAQKDAPTYEPPFEYRDLKPVFEGHYTSPLELHKALISYQFMEIVERFGGVMFTIDRILNYMARLLLVERWQELDMHKGISIIDTIEEGVK